MLACPWCRRCSCPRMRMLVLSTMRALVCGLRPHATRVAHLASCSSRPSAAAATASRGWTTTTRSTRPSRRASPSMERRCFCSPSCAVSLPTERFVCCQRASETAARAWLRALPLHGVCPLHGALSRVAWLLCDAARAQLAFVFIDGQLLHAVRKEPAGWDAAHDAQPVTRLDSPPADAEGIARAALDAARTRLGLPTHGNIFLARVDLLPSNAPDDGADDDASAPAGAAALPQSSRHAPLPDGGSGARNRKERWLVSELELGWPHLFLRCAPDGTAAAAKVVADALVRRMAVAAAAEGERTSGPQASLDAARPRATSPLALERRGRDPPSDAPLPFSDDRMKRKRCPAEDGEERGP